MKLGIITNAQEGVYQRNVIEGIRRVASRFHYVVSIDSLLDRPVHQPALATTLDLNQLAGVLVIANAIPDESIREIYACGKPISLVSHHLPDLPIPSVTANNTQGIALLMKHLVIKCQRRNFVFICGDDRQIDARQREFAFRRELLRYNLPLRESHFLRGEFSPDIAGESLLDFLQQEPEFDAIVAADFLMAESALRLLQEAGYRVPEDVSVVGFGDGPEAHERNLTTVAANVIELGERSARQLHGQITGLSIRGITVLSVKLVIRGTCCPNGMK